MVDRCWYRPVTFYFNVSIIDSPPFIKLFEDAFPRYYIEDDDIDVMRISRPLRLYWLCYFPSTITHMHDILSTSRSCITAMPWYLFTAVMMRLLSAMLKLQHKMPDSYAAGWVSEAMAMASGPLINYARLRACDIDDMHVRFSILILSSRARQFSHYEPATKSQQYSNTTIAAILVNFDLGGSWWMAAL